MPCLALGTTMKTRGTYTLWYSLAVSFLRHMHPPNGSTLRRGEISTVETRSSGFVIRQELDVSVPSSTSRIRWSLFQSLLDVDLVGPVAHVAESLAPGKQSALDIRQLNGSGPTSSSPDTASSKTQARQALRGNVHSCTLVPTW